MHDDFFEIVQRQWNIVRNRLGISKLPDDVDVSIKPHDGSSQTISSGEFKPVLDIIRNDRELFVWLKKQSSIIFSDEKIKYLWDCDKTPEWFSKTDGWPHEYALIRNLFFNFFLDLSEDKARNQELQGGVGKKVAIDSEHRKRGRPRKENPESENEDGNYLEMKDLADDTDGYVIIPTKNACELCKISWKNRKIFYDRLRSTYKSRFKKICVAGIVRNGLIAVNQSTKFYKDHWEGIKEMAFDCKNKTRR